MALTKYFEGVWYTSSGAHGTDPFTTGSFTPEANALLLVFVAMMLDNAAGDIGEPTVSGGSLSYTLVGQAREENLWGIRQNIFYAETGGSPGAMTIEVDDDDNENIYTYAVAVYSITGYNTTTSIDGFVTTGTVDAGDGAHSLTLTVAPESDDFSFIALASDCESPSDPIWTMGWSEDCDPPVFSGGCSLAIATRTSETSTTAAVTDVYDGAGSFYKSTMLAFNVNAGAGGYTLAADAGSHTLTGQTAGLLASRLLETAAGSYAVTGQAAALLVGRLLAADAGSYTQAGPDAALVLARVLGLDAGGYTLDGLAISFVYSGISTPTSRIYVIVIEDRVYVILGEARTHAIDAESRVHAVLAA